MNTTSTHRLILPSDANHHGTLYAGSLLRITLEAAYATAWRHVGTDANLVLRRVLNIECLRPVPVGTVIEIQGQVVHRSQTYLVTGLVGLPLADQQTPWMEALLGFAQIDERGRPTALPRSSEDLVVEAGPHWESVLTRMQKLLRVR